MEELFSYRNGNYTVKMYSNGTKIRILDDGETAFNADFPENIDVKISNHCSIGCEFCHEGCTKGGSFIFVDYLTTSFLNSLNPGTELAVGGGALSEMGNTLWLFLRKAKESMVFANITINALELLNTEFFLKLFLHIRTSYGVNNTNEIKFQRFLQLHPEIFNRLEGEIAEGLINGIGISYNSNETARKRMLLLKQAFHENVVIHTIYGITKKEDYDWLVENGFKILVLGYKNFGRGEEYFKNFNKTIESNMRDFDKNFSYYLKAAKYISFDCLATEQVKLKSKIPNDTWEARYMGNDGNFTMYVDLVNHKFGTSSTTPNNEREYMALYKYDASLMFNAIKNKNI